MRVSELIDKLKDLPDLSVHIEEEKLGDWSLSSCEWDRYQNIVILK